MSEKPAVVEWIPARVGGRPGFRLMVVLAAPGCAYYTDAGGCTNCGFPQAFGTGGPVGVEAYRAQAETALGRIPAGAVGPVEVDFYCSGSYLNPAEVPDAAQVEMLALAVAHPAVAALLIESRPEYVTPDRLARVAAAAGGKPLEIGIGLESANAAILARRIHKGYTWEDFAAAAALMAAARVGLVAYVLLKPLGVGERAAIEDSTDTALKVFALGRSLGLPVRVALEPCFIAPDTPLQRAFRQGRYRTPWLWSVVEVVSRAAPHGRVVVGLSDEGMNPDQVAHNCPACSARVRAALSHFNQTGDPEPLGRLECECRLEWQVDTGPAFA